MRLLNLTLTAALGVTVLAGCGEGSSKAPEGDVSVSTCATDPAGGKPKAEGSIVNNTSKPSGYTFRVAFLDSAGNEVSQGSAGVGRVEAGGTATWRLDGGVSAQGALRCELRNVTRTAVGT
jgi:hypothetical protein